MTTLALALAGMWPVRVPTVMVEADASGGDVAAWRRMPSGPGLVELAATARNDTAFTPAEQQDVLLDHTQRLPGGQSVCTAPVTTDRAGGAVRLLAQHPGVLRPVTDTVTVVDLGRLIPRAPAVHLAAFADVALLVVGDDVAQLKRAKESIAALRLGISGLGLVVVGGSGGTGQVSRAVGAPVWGRIPVDERGGAFLRGEYHQARPRRRPLLAAARRLAHTIIDAEESGQHLAEVNAS